MAYPRRSFHPRWKIIWAIHLCSHSSQVHIFLSPSTGAALRDRSRHTTRSKWPTLCGTGCVVFESSFFYWRCEGNSTTTIGVDSHGSLSQNATGGGCIHVPRSRRSTMSATGSRVCHWMCGQIYSNPNATCIISRFSSRPVKIRRVLYWRLHDPYWVCSALSLAYRDAGLWDMYVSSSVLPPVNPIT